MPKITSAAQDRPMHSADGKLEVPEFVADIFDGGTQC